MINLEQEEEDYKEAVAVLEKQRHDQKVSLGGSAMFYWFVLGAYFYWIKEIDFSLITFVVLGFVVVPLLFGGFRYYLQRLVEKAILKCKPASLPLSTGEVITLKLTGAGMSLLTLVLIYISVKYLIVLI